MLMKSLPIYHSLTYQILDSEICFVQLYCIMAITTEHIVLVHFVIFNYTPIHVHDQQLRAAT